MPDRSPWVSRRRFLYSTLGSALTAGVGLGSYARWVEPHWLRVVRRTMPIAGLPAALEGRTLVQISDLHVGPHLDLDYMAAALEQVNALEPDVLALTGDYMTWHGMHGPAEIDGAVRMLARLKPARLATLATLGNHDYGSRWSMTRLADQLAAQLQDLGMEVLRNRTTDVAGLRVGGLDDYWSPCFEPKKVFGVPADKQPMLVLSHNPDTLDVPVWGGYRGWVLSGHTHGGQCRPPFLEAPVLPVKNKRYTSGLIPLEDGRRVYINPGLGYVHRVRFCVPPEITVFTLTREQPTGDGTA